jgi:transposase-like protein
MTAEQVVGYLLEGEGLDLLRESLSWVVQQLMEAEVSELVGAARGERAPEERLAHRNGYRSRAWQTRAGELELAIPKLRRGSYFPSFLEPRRRSEQALVSVVQEAYVAGVSTRKVDQVVESLGLRISKSEVSRICQGLDEQVDAFRNRPLEGRYPYLWLDAKVEKVRDSGRVVRKALVLAYGVHESGYREVIALDVGEAETEAFWRSFLRSLVERGLSGVQLVVSDAHAGLKKAIGQVLGCPWQRCSVHFLREALGHARREQQPMLAALLRPLFNAEGDAASIGGCPTDRTHGLMRACFPGGYGQKRVEPIRLMNPTLWARKVRRSEGCRTIRAGCGAARLHARLRLTLLPPAPGAVAQAIPRDQGARR